MGRKLFLAIQVAIQRPPRKRVAAAAREEEGGRLTTACKATLRKYTSDKSNTHSVKEC